MFLIMIMLVYLAGETLSEDEKTKINKALNDVLARFEENIQGFTLPTTTA